MTKVAQQFNVSGSYLARVCSVMNVPRPERGYWAKLAVGKAPSPTPLPEPRPGDQLNWSRNEPLRSSTMPTPARPRTIRRKKSALPIKTGTHELIRSALPHFEKSRPSEPDVYIKPSKRVMVDIISSQECLSKSLAFANDLFNALETAGHRVMLAPSHINFRRHHIDEHEQSVEQKRDFYSRLWAPCRPTIVYIGEVAFGITIVEMSEKVLLRYVRGKYVRDADYVPPKRQSYYGDRSWTTTRDMPSGRLRLVVYSPYSRVSWATTWQETSNTPLSGKIGTIVRAIESQASDLVDQLEEAARRAETANQEWLAAQERRKREEDRRQVQLSVKESGDHLNQVIQQWGSVINVERFLAGVERRIAELPDTDRKAAAERLRLAREFLGNQYPLKFFLAWKTPEERYQRKYKDPGTDIDIIH
tara:strand:- start:130976 stop:132229 length:1254 start_codon:yes stop_codon:yes gene_type:complete